MWLLLIIPFIVFVVLGLTVASLAAVVGALINAGPWLLVAVGIWLLFAGPKGRRQQAWNAGCGDWGGGHKRKWEKRHRRNQVPMTVQAPQRPAAPPAPTPIRAAAPKPEKRELPIDVEVKVQQIRGKADVLLGYANRFGPFSHDLYLVRQTASDYLPRTVDAFLRLPAEAVDRPIDATGKTPLEELTEQLTLLDSKLDEIAQDLQREDVDRLLANRRFLEDKFGSEVA